MLEWLVLGWMLDAEYTNWGGELGPSESHRIVATLNWDKEPWSTRLLIPYNGDQPIWRPKPWTDYSDFRIRQIPDINQDNGKLVKGHDHLYDIQLDVLYNSVGLSVVFSNSEDGTAARGQVLLGPQIKNKYMRLTHHFDVYGDNDIDTSITTLELFLEKKFEKFSIYSEPEIMIDWKALPYNKTAIPISLGIRTNNKISVGFQIDYYIVTPKRFGPEWQLSFKIRNNK